jgi:acetyl esterase
MKLHRIVLLLLVITFSINVSGQAYSSLIFKTVGSISERVLTRYPLQEKDEYPAIIFFHGGSFVSGGPDQFLDFFNYFNKKGYATFSVDYRLLTYSTNKVEDLVEDTTDAVNWVYKNCVSLRIDTRKVFVCGFSAGSYLALASLMLDPQQRLENIPNGFVLIGAPVNPADIDEKYLNKEELARDTKYYSPYYHIKSNLPPMLFIQGTKDEEVSYDDVVMFVSRSIETGNNCQLLEFKDKGHHLFNSSNDLNTIFDSMSKFMDSL